MAGSQAGVSQAVPYCGLLTLACPPPHFQWWGGGIHLARPGGWTHGTRGSVLGLPVAPLPRRATGSTGSS